MERIKPRPQMRPRVSMRKALADPQLLGNALPGQSWKAWRTLLIAAMGEKLTPDERELFTQLTGRDHEPNTRIEELVAVVGRRGGKSKAMSVLAIYLAALCDHPLSRGEQGVCLLIAPDQRQAAICLAYSAAILESSPILSQVIVNRNSDTLQLRKNISLEVRAASFRRLRGPTYVCVICDEAAFWHTEDFRANADSEIINSVRPGLATTSGPLIIASSPYARKGVLYETHRRHFGPQGDKLILVAQGSSRTFNSSLSQRVVDRALERDPASANAEYMAQFRLDVETFVSREAVDACVINGRRELPPTPGIHYRAFVDPSGGSSDSMTLAISHKDRDGYVILDCLRERKPPFSPAAVVKEFCDVLKLYNIHKVVGDCYAGEFAREPFRQNGHMYELAEEAKSSYYQHLLPLINSGKAQLLDHPRMLSQLCNLERRVSRAGKDSIDHPPHQHDDLINAVAGSLVLAATAKAPMKISQAVLERARLPAGFDGAFRNPNETSFTSMSALLMSRGG